MSDLADKIKHFIKILLIILFGYMFIIVSVSVAKIVIYEKKMSGIKNEIQLHFSDTEVLKCKISTETSPAKEDSSYLWISIHVDSGYSGENVFKSINSIKTTLEKMQSYNEAINTKKIIIAVRKGIDAPNYVRIVFNNNGYLIPEAAELNEINTIDEIWNLDNIENIKELELSLENASLSLDFLNNFNNLESLKISSDFEDVKSVCKLKHLKYLYIKNYLDEEKYLELKNQLSKTDVKQIQ